MICNVWNCPKLAMNGKTVCKEHAARWPQKAATTPPSVDKVRTFKTGATRDALGDKLEYRRFLSHAVLKRYCEYMHEHRKQADGSLREPDNWKKGIPVPVYADSLYRHMQQLAEMFEALDTDKCTVTKELEDTICAIIFNAMGMLHELLKSKV